MPVRSHGEQHAMTKKKTCGAGFFLVRRNGLFCATSLPPRHAEHTFQPTHGTPAIWACFYVIVRAQRPTWFKMVRMYKAMATTRFEEGTSYSMFHTPAMAVHDDDVEQRSGDAIWISYGQSNKLKRQVQVRDGAEYVVPGGRGTRSLSASQPTWRTPGMHRLRKRAVATGCRCTLHPPKKRTETLSCYFCFSL